MLCMSFTEKAGRPFEGSWGRPSCWGFLAWLPSGEYSVKTGGALSRNPPEDP